MQLYLYATHLFLLTVFCVHKTLSEEMNDNDEREHPVGNVDEKCTLSAFVSSSSGENLTTFVYHSVEVIDISRVSLETMDFRVDLHLKQRWIQHESRFPKQLFPEDSPEDAYISINPDENRVTARNMWVPDAYIPNARITQILILSATHSSLVIYKNRTIVYSARLYAILGCQMAFHWYPMDVQHCEFLLESYSFPIREVVFLWENISNPVITDPDIKLLRYALKIPLAYHNGTQGRFGRHERFSRLIVKFTFERQIGQQLIQVFTPTFLIVALSWFSFWLGLDAVPGRVSLVVTCMLTLVTMYSGMKADLPPVAYIKMLDVWICGCLAFVFAAMSEFIIVKYISWSIERRIEKRENELRKLNFNWNSNKLTSLQNSSVKFSLNFPQPNPMQQKSSVMAANNNNKSWKVHPDYLSQSNDFEKPPLMNSKWALNTLMDEKASNGKTDFQWESIDRVSRIAFPLLFMVFLSVFWPVLILGANSKK